LLFEKKKNLFAKKMAFQTSSWKAIFNVFQNILPIF